jgi:anti-sigma B factor antagonist
MHLADHGTYQVLTLQGDLDAAACDQLRAVFDELLAADSHAVIDMTDVVFIDSSGLGAIVGGARRMRERGGEILLAGPRPAVARVLRMTGIDRVLPVAADRADATLRMDELV